MKEVLLTAISVMVMGISMAQQNHYWTPISGNQYNMSVFGVVLINGVEQQSTALEVGAFCGEECRGSDFAQYFLPLNQYLVPLNIRSNVASGEIITFRLYNHNTDQILESNQTLTYDQGMSVSDYQFEFVAPDTGYHFVTEGNWSEVNNWSGNALPGTEDEVFIDAPCNFDQNAIVAALTVSDGQSITLQAGKTLTVSGTLTNTDNVGLIIKDGAQLVNASANVGATVEKVITGYVDENGWYTISSPMNEMAIVGSDFVTGDYDLYRYNESNLYNEEWENYKADFDDFTTFENVRGYLYANYSSFSPAFVGTLNNADLTYSLSYTDRPDDCLDGFNLIGNPFPHVIYKGCGGAIDNASLASGYYKLANSGAWEVCTYEDAIQPGQGIMVKTIAVTELSVAKSNVVSSSESGGAKSFVPSLDLNVSGTSGSDRAVVYFSRGIGLDKMSNFAVNTPALYIRQDGKDFAIAHFSQEVETMDLMFKNIQSGMFTFSVSINDTSFNYLHLVDRITGTNVDMLQQSNYTFHAAGNENEDRFMLEFKVETGVEELEASEVMVYPNPTTARFTVEATEMTHVSVFNTLGQVVYEANCEGNVTEINLSNVETGIYMVRIDTKTGSVTKRITVIK